MVYPQRNKAAAPSFLRWRAAVSLFRHCFVIAANAALPSFRRKPESILILSLAFRVVGPFRENRLTSV
jgi:hypothetical protein